MVNKKWIIRDFDFAKMIELRDHLGMSNDLLCSLFVARGIDTFDKAKNFFSPEMAHLHDPFRLRDMTKATDRILNAICEKEKILLVGDYDVDGTCATAMFMQFLGSIYLSESFSYYIPDRYKEGYGVSRSSLDYAKQRGSTLIITLDCGITANDIIEEATDCGIDFIVCDHHLPGKDLPEAFAIINPKHPLCDYPFKELCGCGVAFKLITALSKVMKLPDETFLRYLDLVALATGADVVPVLGENRVLVHFGLKKINSNPCNGIKALKELNPKISEYNLRDVVFGLAPKINAAGRMAHGSLAVDLLSETNEAKASEIAKEINHLNDLRKEEETAVTEDALNILMADQSTGSKVSSVVYKSGWHKGVLGIVASRLIESYYKPTIVLTAGKEFVAGSARSIHGFNIYQAISECEEYLVQFGGHVAAAGIILKNENLQFFKRKFEGVVARSLSESDRIPRISIDLEIGLEDIKKKFYNVLHRMEPFGHGNPRPVFLTRNVQIHPYSRIVGDNHIKFVFSTDKGKLIDGIGFNMAEKFHELDKSKLLDIVYSINENEWNNQKSLQLNIIDFKTTTRDDDGI